MNGIIDKVHQINERAWSGRNNDIHESLRLAQQAQTLLGESAEENMLEMAASLRTQAYCQDQLGLYEQALTIAKQGMQLANQSGDPLMIAMLDNVLGNIYWGLDDFSSALNLYLNGLELIQKNPDQELEIYLIQGLGIVYFSMGIYEEALKYFKLSAEVAFPEDCIGRAIGLNNVAYTLSEMKRGAEALPYALKAQEIFEKGSFSVGKVEVLHTLGSIYLDLGNIDQAIHFFGIAVQVADQQENHQQKTESLLGICRVHLARGEYEDARQQLLLFLEISKEMSSPASQQCTAHEMLAGIYKRMGDYQMALEHYDTFHNIYVQMYNEQTYRHIHNAQVLREVEAIRKQAALYRALAATDALTGLLSRREFFELGAKAIHEAQSTLATVSLLMIDVDYFKLVNDQYGHAVGDQVLAIITGRLKKALRKNDLAGRYGGDEFVVLLPDTDARQCRKIAQRCRKEVAKEPIQVNLLKISMNISVGLAVFNHVNTFRLEDMIEQADQALLSAKRNGRNCVMRSKSGSLDVLNSDHPDLQTNPTLQVLESPKAVKAESV